MNAFEKSVFRWRAAKERPRCSFSVCAGSHSHSALWTETAHRWRPSGAIHPGAAIAAAKPALKLFGGWMIPSRLRSPHGESHWFLRESGHLFTQATGINSILRAEGEVPAK
jgi:hypothetical protein